MLLHNTRDRKSYKPSFADPDATDWVLMSNAPTGGECRGRRADQLVQYDSRRQPAYTVEGNPIIVTWNDPDRARRDRRRS